MIEPTSAAVPAVVVEPVSETVPAAVIEPISEAAPAAVIKSNKIDDRDSSSQKFIDPSKFKSWKDIDLPKQNRGNI